MRNQSKFYSFREKSAKMKILDILSTNWPLSVRDLHKSLSNSLDNKLTYQAVHKSVKGLLKEGCLTCLSNKYQIDLEWIKEMSNKFQKMEANYQGQFLFPNTIIQEGSDRINILIAKEGFIRDQLREQRLKQVLKELAIVYREEFPIHNLFQKEEPEVVEYLLNIQQSQEMVVFTLNDKVVGGTTLEKKYEDSERNHILWKLKHFTLKEELEKKLGESFLDQIEDRIKKRSKTAKVLVNLADNEERHIKFFMRFGFKKEGTLKNYYRSNEDMYIFSKFIK